MRRLAQHPCSYSVEFAGSVSRLLARLPREVKYRITSELHALAELAEVAPILHLGVQNDDGYALPLHLTVGEWIVTYVIERRGRTVRVIQLEPA